MRPVLQQSGSNGQVIAVHGLCSCRCVTCGCLHLGGGTYVVGVCLGASPFDKQVTQSLAATSSWCVSCLGPDIQHPCGLHVFIVPITVPVTGNACCVLVFMSCRCAGCCGCAAADAPPGRNSRGASQAAVSAEPGAAVVGAAAGVCVVDLWTAVASAPAELMP